MANRNFNRSQNLEKEVKGLFADVAIGASGAPTINKALGITSIARDAAGTYTIILDDKYTRLMSVSLSVVAAAAEDITLQVLDDSVSSTKSIQIATLAAGTETDPSDGSKLLIKIELKNSSVGE